MNRVGPVLRREMQVGEEESQLLAGSLEVLLLMVV
jgi:hypothetical protein